MIFDNDTSSAIRAAAEADSRYSEYAYEFVLSAVESTLTGIGERRHISGEELLEGVRDITTRQFGPMAKEVLNHWGVFTTLDLGHIIFSLIRAGLLEAASGDSLDDFDGVYDFKTVFEDDYYSG
ncbi:MAG: hypothetical protein PHQ19_07400 [Candidatus Krumholzibacteria bacterium]|nr:hypothetical protein [Candidatus Krumholzibacteria bacterium]